MARTNNDELETAHAAIQMLSEHDLLGEFLRRYVARDPRLCTPRIGDKFSGISLVYTVAAVDGGRVVLTHRLEGDWVLTLDEFHRLCRTRYLESEPA